MSLKNRLRSLERAIPLVPRRLDEMQSAYNLWNKAVEHNAVAYCAVLGCIVRRKMKVPGPYDTALSDEQRKVFTDWAAGVEKKYGQTLEAAWDELERAGTLSQMRRAVKESLNR